MNRVRRLMVVLGLVAAASGVGGVYAAQRDKGTDLAAMQRRAEAMLPPAVKQLTLSADQQAQIFQVQQAIQLEIKALHEKEMTQIRALLTDEQRAQLDKIDAARKAERKAQQKAKKAAQAPPAAE